MVEFSVINLKRLSVHDYPCRVLRAVFRKSQTVRQRALLEFREDFNFGLENFHSIFMLTEVIRTSKDPGEFDFVIELFTKLSRALLAKKIFKRIPFTLIEHCNQKQLKIVEHYLNLNSTLHLHLNDKISISVLISLTRRNPESCVAALVKYFELRPYLLLKSRQSYLLFIKLTDISYNSVSKRKSSQIRTALFSLQWSAACMSRYRKKLPFSDNSIASRNLFLAYCNLLACGNNAGQYYLQTSICNICPQITI